MKGTNASIRSLVQPMGGVQRLSSIGPFKSEASSNGCGGDNERGHTACSAVEEDEVNEG